MLLCHLDDTNWTRETPFSHSVCERGTLGNAPFTRF